MRALGLASTVAALELAFVSSAHAGCIVPMPTAGMGGPLALVAVIGAFCAYKFYQSTQR